MFTGIIQTIGTIQKITPETRTMLTAASKPTRNATLKRSNSTTCLTLEIAPQKILPNLHPGNSIAVDGVCLTVVSQKKGSFTVNIVPETLKNIHFQHKKIGDIVNLEQALKLGDRLEGHIVLGHCDGIGKVQKITKNPSEKCPKTAEGHLLTIKFPKTLRRYLAPKGSIAINGVSLTIQNIAQNHFTVALIPFTLSHTNLGFLKAGDTINLEIDPISRYLETLLHENHRREKPRR